MRLIEKSLSEWKATLCDSFEIGGLFARNKIAHKWKATFRSLELRETIAWRTQDLLEQSLFLFDVRIVTERKQVKMKVSPGRPSLTKSVYKNKWTFSHGIEWELNEKALAEASRTDGIFPLISNTSLDAGDVLRSYKDQPFLEKRMYTKKTVLEVAPVFLKKTDRIEAMIFLYFIALMIVSLIERKIRMNMVKEKVEKLPILPQGMNTEKPTWNNIRYYFRNVHYSEINKDGTCIQSAVKGIGTLHERVCSLLEIPDAVYKTLHDAWWQFKAT